MALITLGRATELVPNFPSADNSVMQDIIDACSALVEKYCNRTFAVTSYDELYDGTGHPNLLLNNYPVTQIDRVLFNPTQVVSIGNTLSTVSRASFRLSSTSLILTSAASGVATTRTITRASYPTLTDLAGAINAFSADGWVASALGQYGTFSTSDLWSPQGGYEVRWTGYGYLWHHTFGVPASMQNPIIGEIVSSFGFQRGYQAYRCLYSAGFSTVPYEVQQACAELAASTYLARETNPNLQSETLGQYSYTNLAERSFDNLSIGSRHALALYRNTRIAKYKAF